MSRIGKKPITIPAGVTVSVKDATVTVKGPKGTLTQEVDRDIIVEVEGNEVNVKRPTEQILH
jgi:large subunit ribosomal protein L6